MQRQFPSTIPTLQGIWENKKGQFQIGPTVVADQEYAADFRLVVDYPEDYQLFQSIYDALYKEGETISVPEVIVFLRAHPDIAEINISCNQKSLK